MAFWGKGQFLLWCEASIQRSGGCGVDRKTNLTEKRLVRVSDVWSEIENPRGECAACSSETFAWFSNKRKLINTYTIIQPLFHFAIYVFLFKSDFFFLLFLDCIPRAKPLSDAYHQSQEGTPLQVARGTFYRGQRGCFRGRRQQRRMRTLSIF